MYHCRVCYVFFVSCFHFFLLLERLMLLFANKRQRPNGRLTFFLLVYSSSAKQNKKWLRFVRICLRHFCCSLSVLLVCQPANPPARNGDDFFNFAHKSLFMRLQCQNKFPLKDKKRPYYKRTLSQNKKTTKKSLPI